MRFSRQEELPYSIEDVFARSREQVHVLADVLPDIRSIEPLHMRVDERVTERVDRWRTRTMGASRRTLPTTKLEFVSRSRWHAETHRVTWDIELNEPAGAATCSGVIQLEELGPSSTRLSLDADLVVDGGALRHAMRVLSFAWRPLVERAVRGVVDRNLAVLRGKWSADAARRSRPASDAVAVSGVRVREDASGAVRRAG